jgi:hypothetical protein
VNDLLKYIEDKSFVRWVFRTGSETDVFWEKYLLDHPDERGRIDLARTILSQLRSKERRQDQDEVYQLYTSVIQKLDRQKKTARIFRMGVTFAKYAAVALIFLVIGIIWKNSGDEFSLPPLSDQFVNQPLPDNNTRLILSDGKNITIREKESSVQLQANGQIIINRKDTVRSQTDPVHPGINQLIIPFGRNSSIKLPDGTTAFLNAGSRLIYPSFFEGKKREVSLVGEGYFDVAHNPDMPFIVTTTNLEVKALGTRFNVSAYPTDQIMEVVLAEGKVALREHGFSIKRQQILEPLQMASFNKETQQIAVKRVNVDDYISWHKGYLNFESTDLSRIIIKIERYYDIKIGLQDPLTGQKKITGKLKLKEDMDKVLHVLASSADLKLIKVSEQKYVLK